MSKLRSVNTQFWSDPWIEELTPSEKLLYLYFITNEKTNMLGIYELSIKKISFETGIDRKTVEKTLEAFERVGKVKYTKHHIVLLNFAKHQNYNTNMKKSAIDTYNNLPNYLKPNDKDVVKDNPSEGFEMVVKCLGMVRKIEVEVEYEKETKVESETKKEIENLFETFWNLYDKKVDRKKTFDKWNKLDIETMEKIIKVTPLYVKKHSEVQYRKNPVTFLNNESWNDDLTIPKNDPTDFEKNPHLKITM